MPTFYIYHTFCNSNVVDFFHFIHWPHFALTPLTCFPFTCFYIVLSIHLEITIHTIKFILISMCGCSCIIKLHIVNVLLQCRHLIWDVLTWTHWYCFSSAAHVKLFGHLEQLKYFSKCLLLCLYKVFSLTIVFTHIATKAMSFVKCFHMETCSSMHFGNFTT